MANLESLMKTFNKRDLAETCISLGRKLSEAEAEIERLQQRVVELEAWSRRAFVVLSEIEADGEWGMFNLLTDAPPQVQGDEQR